MLSLVGGMSVRSSAINPNRESNEVAWKPTEPARVTIAQFRQQLNVKGLRSFTVRGNEGGKEQKMEEMLWDWDVLHHIFFY